MKVACIGNMNNMMFTLCRFLRDEGIDAYLFVFKDEPFLPEHDSYTKDYLDYCEFLKVNASNFTDRKYKKNLKHKFKSFDYLIGIDIAPALMTFLGLKLNMFIPHGSDIYEYPFIKRKKKTSDIFWWLKEIFLKGKLQKIGIENVSYIVFPFEYDKHFPFKSKLNTKGEYIDMTIPMVYHPQYNKGEINSSLIDEQYRTILNTLRKENDLIVFSHARQNGINLTEEYKLHLKGNDVLIEGFADFVKNNPKIKSCLILFEYGVDIEFSKAKIKELNIEGYIVWFPKIKRKDIMYCISISDIGCGEFENSWLTCGVVNEILTIGKPLLHYRDDEIYSGELYPILNAKNPNDIKINLEKFMLNKEVIIKESLNGIEWLEKFTVRKPISIIKEKIKEKSLKKLDFKNLVKKELIIFNFRMKFSHNKILYKFIKQ